MNVIEIKRFDNNNLEQLAKDQTAVYNEAIKDFKGIPPANEEDVIARFKRKEFDPLRMFYAFDNNKMIGYAGLTGRDKELNLRGVGYPWLVKEANVSIRELLYGAMEHQCESEGTKTMRTFTSDRFRSILDFFKEKNFTITQEFLVYQKELEKNHFSLPDGYTIRSLKREDLPKLEYISKRDPKMKTPFSSTDMGQFMDSKNYDPSQIVVAEKNGQVVAYFALNNFVDPISKTIFFGGATTDPNHQEIESILMMELENRAIEREMKLFNIAYYPDSLRLPLAKERGFKQIAKNFQLEKPIL